MENKKYLTNFGESKEEPLFFVKEVAELLGYRKGGTNKSAFNVYQLYRNLNQAEVIKIPKTGRNGKPTNDVFLTKNGLIELLHRSRKPNAENLLKLVEDVYGKKEPEEITFTTKPEPKQKVETMPEPKQQIKILQQQQVLGKTFTIYVDVENPLFLAKDVAEWIDYSKRTDGSYQVGRMLNTIDDEEKLFTVNNSNGRESWFLTEDGLYEVLMQSRKPIAKAFKKEVKVILKSIRKHGAYVTAPTLEEMLNDPQTMIVTLQTLDKERKEREKAQRELQIKENVIEEMTPKVEYHDKVLQDDHGMTMTTIAKDYGKGAPTLNKKLNDLGFIYKCDGNWICYAKYQNEGYQTTGIIHDCYGKARTVYKWTQKGRKKIHELLASVGEYTVDEMRKAM